MAKPILCLDFDGVIHSYVSGWKGADAIPDRIVDGAMRFIRDAQDHFTVAIFSSRSNQPGGLAAMQGYIEDNFTAYFCGEDVSANLAAIEWPLEKPPAMITIDDRALTFDGTWPSIESLRTFQPWNKMPSKAALHASAPPAMKCTDCSMAEEACPECYSAWWRRRHPNFTTV